LGIAISKWLRSACVGDREQRCGDAALGLPDAFHRRQLGRLMFQCVQPMQVADDDLQRHHDAEEGERHLHHHAAFLDVPALAQEAGGDGEDHEAAGDEEGDDRVREAVRKRRREQHRQHADRLETPVHNDVALRRLHPAVDRENPERRHQRAECDHHG